MLFICYRNFHDFACEYFIFVFQFGDRRGGDDAVDEFSNIKSHIFREKGLENVYL